MYATYRRTEGEKRGSEQERARKREKRRRGREEERERPMDGQGVSGEDIISPMQIAFGLRPAEYTLALAISS